MLFIVGRDFGLVHRHTNAIAAVREKYHVHSDEKEVAGVYQLFHVASRFEIKMTITKS